MTRYSIINDRQRHEFMLLNSFDTTQNTFYYYHWFHTSTGGLLISEGITRSVVCVLPLTWFIRYIYHWHSQVLINILTPMIKTKVIFPQIEVTLYRFLLSCLASVIFFIAKTFELSGCQCWTYLKKVIHFFPVTSVSSTSKSDHHDTTEQISIKGSIIVTCT